MWWFDRVFGSILKKIVVHQSILTFCNNWQKSLKHFANLKKLNEDKKQTCNQIENWCWTCDNAHQPHWHKKNIIWIANIIRIHAVHTPIDEFVLLLLLLLLWTFSWTDHRTLLKKIVTETNAYECFFPPYSQ